MQFHLVVAGVLAISGSASAWCMPVCGQARTTVELRECMSTLIVAAEKKLDEYIASANSRMLQKLPSEKVDIALTQVIWRNYLEAQCGDVYKTWSSGTIRYEKGSVCQLELLRERTHDIWSSYLTYVDSTPPDLPEP